MTIFCGMVAYTNKCDAHNAKKKKKIQQAGGGVARMIAVESQKRRAA